MPNRYIRASAIESESINALSWQAEVFYRRLLNRADDFGRYTANPALLRASLFPLQLSRVSEKEITKLLAECEQSGLVFTYAANGKALLVINKWEQGRAKTSEYPPPPDDVNKRMQTYVYTGKHKSAHAPDSDSDSDTDTDSDVITEIYSAYPLKVGKANALKAIGKALTAHPINAQEILEATRAYAAATALWPEADRKFIPHPATWFNRGSYEDDPATWKRGGAAALDPEFNKF